MSLAEARDLTQQTQPTSFKKNGEAKINDSALVAIALLVAQSEPSQKETMIKLIINLIKSA